MGILILSPSVKLEFDKLLTTNENVEIHTFSNKILFKYNGYLFQSSLLNGTYPNTSNLIPNEFSIILTTSLDKYFSAIDRAALLTQSKEKNIVKMETRNNELIVSSYASEIGKSEESVKVDKNTSEDISISFSSKYMLDALKTFTYVRSPKNIWRGRITNILKLRF